LFFRDVLSPVGSEENQVRFNPLLLSIFPYWFQLWSRDSWDLLCDALFSTPQEESPGTVGKAGIAFPGIAHPNASWRRMYPVLPPIRRVEFSVTDIESDLTRLGEVDLSDLQSDGPGLKMCFLYDTVREFWRAGCDYYYMDWLGGFTDSQKAYDEMR
jgi:hypothetical protein